jgi:hypothetical protein
MMEEYKLKILGTTLQSILNKDFNSYYDADYGMKVIKGLLDFPSDIKPYFNSINLTINENDLSNFYDVKYELKKVFGIEGFNEEIEKIVLDKDLRIRQREIDKNKTVYFEPQYNFINNYLQVHDYDFTGEEIFELIDSTFNQFNLLMSIIKDRKGSNETTTDILKQYAKEKIKDLNEETLIFLVIREIKNGYQFHRGKEINKLIEFFEDNFDDNKFKQPIKILKIFRDYSDDFDSFKKVRSLENV